MSSLRRGRRRRHPSDSTPSVFTEYVSIGVKRRKKENRRQGSERGRRRRKKLKVILCMLPDRGSRMVPHLLVGRVQQELEPRERVTHGG